MQPKARTTTAMKLHSARDRPQIAADEGGAGNTDGDEGIGMAFTVARLAQPAAAYRAPPGSVPVGVDILVLRAHSGWLGYWPYERSRIALDARIDREEQVRQTRATAPVGIRVAAGHAAEMPRMIRHVLISTPHFFRRALEVALVQEQLASRDDLQQSRLLHLVD